VCRYGVPSHRSRNPYYVDLLDSYLQNKPGKEIDLGRLDHVRLEHVQAGFVTRDNV